MKGTCLSSEARPPCSYPSPNNAVTGSFGSKDDGKGDGRPEGSGKCDNKIVEHVHSCDTSRAWREAMKTGQDPRNRSKDISHCCKYSCLFICVSLGSLHTGKYKQSKEKLKAKRSRVVPGNQ